MFHAEGSHCEISYNFFKNLQNKLPRSFFCDVVVGFNANTGEPIHLSKMGEAKSGCEMMSLQGIGHVCNCASKGPQNYDECFVLKGAAGEVLSSMNYTVQFSDGRMLQGVTDAEGKTMRIVTSQSENIKIFLGHLDNDE